MLLELFQERDLVNQIALSNLDDNTMKVIFSSNMTSKPVVEALKKCQEVKFKMGETQRELGLARQQLADIERDQTRIRANLKDRPATAEAYKKYLEKLNAQEGEIDTLTARIKELQEAENQQRKDYEIYLANLSVE
jgi:chromosome segregation ATPase